MVKHSATAPSHNSELTSQIRAAKELFAIKQSTAGPPVVLPLEFNSNTRNWKSANNLEGFY